MYVVLFLGFLLLFFPSFSCLGYLLIGLPWINMFVLLLVVVLVLALALVLVAFDEVERKPNFVA